MPAGITKGISGKKSLYEIAPVCLYNTMRSYVCTPVKKRTSTKQVEMTFLLIVTIVLAI